ncbi:mannose-6-phosphate isomerase, class I [Microbacterium sp. 4R-513]|uniref:mannose-6-phosphate isomerase, class I n=1 Tax=Microbacterium sp. 4R-513 TaxID=2567934 RepID=UPI0013E1F095|nr:mannose-6-phosphate isomerase, class I [Microbacterium sp. 4R-513]QIG38298.1 mannose-6-phosphate isomerase, class I [Microbacterium sp. 4R-513]
MLVSLVNEPRDYAWGSTTLIADLEGRAPSGRPEAEVWYGDHPADPAIVPDGRSLGEWLADEGAAAGAPKKLPYLLKVLAAASPLSIQAHPSKQQAEAGFAREEAAGVARNAPERTYRDDNHKPELIVAVSETFTALAGLRELDATRRLIALLGDAGRPLAQRLEGTDAAASLRDTIAWLLSGTAQADVDAIVAAAAGAEDAEFAAELALSRHLNAAYPGDPGVVVALLMNLVVLQRGEALFVAAGVLHAYVQGLGVELMAASDNVLRGGLTPKHIDVPELLAVLDPNPGPPPVLKPEVHDGVERFGVPGLADFALSHAEVQTDAATRVPLEGVAIALVTSGEVEVTASATGAQATLIPGCAVLVTPDEGTLGVTGSGDLFVATPGR